MIFGSNLSMLLVRLPLPRQLLTLTYDPVADDLINSQHLGYKHIFEGAFWDEVITQI